MLSDPTPLPKQRLGCLESCYRSWLYRDGTFGHRTNGRLPDRSLENLADMTQDTLDSLSKVSWTEEDAEELRRRRQTGESWKETAKVGHLPRQSQRKVAKAQKCMKRTVSALKQRFFRVRLRWIVSSRKD